MTVSDRVYNDFAMEVDMITSKEGVEIRPMDVLCGRGKNSFNHSKCQTK